MRINSLFPRGMQAISSALSIIMLVFIWIILAPTQVGGSASYVIVVGSSMEPKFHIGDLIVVHKEPSYQVGDAVVYRNTEMQGFVFHRIMAEEEGRYVLQGDNNSWVDTYQPTKQEVIGKLWVHIPRGGVTMQRVRSPWMLALIAAVAGAFFANSWFGNKTKGNKYMDKKSLQEGFASSQKKLRAWILQLGSVKTRGTLDSGNGGFLEISFFVLGLALLSSLVVGIISFSRPTSRIVSDDIQYQHLGIFSYLASAPQGIYDSNAIRSGDPIFPRLTCAVDVNLQYTLIAPEATNIIGTYQLTAVIRDQLSGWQRVIPLQEKTSFSGTTFGTTAKLDVCKIESLTQAMEAETEFHPGSYIVSLSPDIRMNGELEGRTLEATVNSGITFLYDHIHLYLQQSRELESPLSFTESGSIKSVRNEVNTILFLGNQISVPLLRWMAVIALLVSLAGFVFLGLRLQTLSNSDQAKYFRVKYDSLIVDISNTDLVDSDNNLNVISMDALAKLAERFNAMILHVGASHSHDYFVQAGGATYQFSLSADRTESTVPGNEVAGAGGDS
jgi:signal peptidase I